MVATWTCTCTQTQPFPCTLAATRKKAKGLQHAYRGSVPSPTWQLSSPAHSLLNLWTQPLSSARGDHYSHFLRGHPSLASHRMDLWAHVRVVRCLHKSSLQWLLPLYAEEKSVASYTVGLTGTTAQRSGGTELVLLQSVKGDTQTLLKLQIVYLWSQRNCLLHFCLYLGYTVHISMALK